MRATRHLKIDQLKENYLFLYGECGLDPTYQLANGDTILHVYLQTCHDVYFCCGAMELIKYGCDYTIRNDSGISYFENTLEMNGNQQFLFDLEKQETEEKMLQLLKTLRLSNNQNIFHKVYRKAEGWYEQSINEFWKLQALNNRKIWYLIQTPDGNGKTPLMLALKSYVTNTTHFLNNHKEFFNYFTDLPVKIGEDLVPLQYLVNSKRFQDSALYAYYLERTSLVNTKPINGVSILHQIVTAQKLNLKAVERALNYSKQKVTQEQFLSFMNQKQSAGKTALVLAAERGSTATMDLLLSFGTTTDCAPYNLVQVMIDHGHHAVALQCMHGKTYNSDVTISMVLSALRAVLVLEEKMKEEGVVTVMRSLVKSHKNELFQGLTITPDVMVTEESSLADHCSIFMLLCNFKKKEIIDWICREYEPFFNASTSPFAQHPLDMLCAVEKLFNNNIFHFVCSDSNLQVLTSTPTQEETLKVNQTATKAIFSRLLGIEKIKEKNLLEQHNKQGDTPLHISCKSNIHSVWPEMLENGVDFSAHNSNGKAPGSLITVQSAITAFNKCTKGKIAKVATKAQKRKQDDVPEETDESAAGYRTRKRSKRITYTENDEDSE
jgi:ankyrin repeat protein